MPLICYVPMKVSENRLDQIARVNLLIKEYGAQGFDLTVRQIYYQFVARGFLPNALKSYNFIQGLCDDGRMAGLIDWDAIVDRTRNVQKNAHWTKPSDILASTHASYATDKWDNQPHYCEVWVEKDALAGVLSGVCSRLDVPLFPCRGYGSSSSVWAAAQRLLAKKDEGKEVHIIHLGDHDPSGIHMSEDIFNRLSLFTYSRVDVQRIALNMDQVERFDPPPFPAKLTDSRFRAYVEKYGEDSWELDALEPSVLVALVEKAVGQYRDEDLWEAALANEERGKHTLECLNKYFPDVIGFLRERRKRDDSPVLCADCGATEANPKCLCDIERRGIQLGDGR